MLDRPRTEGIVPMAVVYLAGSSKSEVMRGKITILTENNFAVARYSTAFMPMRALAPI